MTTQRKICLAIGHGQSNDNGNSIRFQATTNSGASVQVNRIQTTGTMPTALTGVNDWATQLAENMTRAMKLPVVIRNRAVAGSTAVGDWASIASGAGLTATPKRPGDAGYDPHGYIAGLVSDITASKAAGYEVWQFTVLGGNDIAAPYSAAAIAQAHIDIIQKGLDAGASVVWVGLVHGRALTYPTDYSSPTGRQAVARDVIMTHFAADSRVRLGIDMSTFLDNDFKYDTETHLNHMGNQWAARIWMGLLRTAGYIV